MKRLLFISFIFVSIWGYSQGRINKSLPKIITPFKSQLITAKGWRQQPDGQWMGRINRIPEEVDTYSKSLVDYEQTGLGTDNFVSLRLHKLMYEGKNYIILIKNSKSGYYQYESIQEGWVNTHTYHYVVFNESDFLNAFSDIKIDQPNFIKLDIKRIGHIRYGKATTILKDIASKISQEGLAEERESIFVFRIAPFKSKNLVQFLFYDEDISQYSTTIGLFYLSGTLFKQKEADNIYYETNYRAFNSFIALP